MIISYYGYYRLIFLIVVSLPIIYFDIRYFVIPLKIAVTGILVLWVSNIVWNEIVHASTLTGSEVSGFEAEGAEMSGSEVFGFEAEGAEMSGSEVSGPDAAGFGLRAEWAMHGRTMLLLALSGAVMVCIRAMSHKGMGLGDAYVSVLIMAYFDNFFYWYMTLLCAVLVGLGYCLVRRQKKIPFAPFLLFSAMLFAALELT